MPCWRSHMLIYHAITCIYGIPWLNCQKHAHKYHFVEHLCPFTNNFFFRPLPIQAWHLQKCMLPLLRTSQNTLEPRAYRCEKSPACRIYSLVLKTECVITTDQWSCFNGCKSRNPPQDHHRASSPLKADVQIDMHDNAMSVAAATAKLGSYASSNGLPYKDGIYLLCKSECNIFLLCKVIV